MNLKRFLKRKPKPWHLSRAEIEAASKMSHDALLLFYIEQKEQVNRVLRVLTKLKQAIVELELGE